MTDLLIVGSVALDSIETPHGRLEAAQGGSACYASVASSFWAHPSIVAVVGDDYPPAYLEVLEKHGVKMEPGLEVVKGGKSFHWSGLYKGAMHEAITRQTELGVFENFDPKIPDELSGARFLLLGNIDPDLQLKVLEQMTGTELVVVDTMNLWIEIKRKELIEVLKRADLLVLNDGEARLLGEQINLSECAYKLLREYDLKYLIIKKGEHGATLYTKDSLFSVPAFPVSRVKDPTGAGDSFAGGLLGYLARQGEVTDEGLKQSMVTGTVMASFCVEDFSLGYRQNLDAEDIQRRLDKMRANTIYDPITI